jgi:Contractile injection system tube protein
MSSFPRSPRLTKGAIISFDPFNIVPQIIIFQYNPETLTRSLQSQRTNQQGGATAETFRLKGPPTETISLNIELDAADQLEKPEHNAVAATMGVYPQLSALEMILYPKSDLVIANTRLTAAGAIEIIPAEEPFTLFIWGAKRVLPVRLTSFSITEELHDPNLNPISAKISLQLQVLSYADFKVTHQGYALFLAHQIVKETMAAAGSINNLSAVGNVRIS